MGRSAHARRCLGKDGIRRRPPRRQGYIRSLGEGIANIVNLLRPQVIILGGGISNEGESLLGPVRKFVYKNILASKEYAPIEIVRASLGNDAGMYGAAAYAMDRR